MQKINTDKARGALDAFYRARKFQSVNIAGFIENFPDADVYADNPENISVLAAVDRRDRIYTDMLDPSLCGRLAPLLSGFPEPVFGGVDFAVTKAIQDMYVKEVLWQNPCRLYYYPHAEISVPAPPFGELRDIAVRDAAVVDENYAHRSETSLEDITESIQSLPSSALYVGDKPVSWSLMHRDNTMGFMFTFPQYRRDGLGRCVALDLARKLMRGNRLPFLHVVHGNNASYGLVEKSGFVFSHDVVWFEARLK